MSSLVISDFNEVIVATLLIHVDTLSLSMSHFFDNSSMFPINHPSNFDVISLKLLYSFLDTSLVPSATPPQPLQVYTHRSHTDTEPLVDLSSLAPSSTMLVLPSPSDLPIAIRKGTCASRNPYPIYNFLTYHHLSSPYFAFVSSFAFVLFHKLCMWFYPIRIGNRL